MPSSSFKSLASFRGLDKLTSIGGNLILSCNDNPAQYPTSCTSFTALQSCEGLNHLEIIGGSLIFKAGYFKVFESFNGLENLKIIGSNICIKIHIYIKSLV